jgi:hypothetical protein
VEARSLDQSPQQVERLEARNQELQILSGAVLSPIQQLAVGNLEHEIISRADLSLTQRVEASNQELQILSRADLSPIHRAEVENLEHGILSRAHLNLTQRVQAKNLEMGMFSSPIQQAEARRVDRSPQQLEARNLDRSQIQRVTGGSNSSEVENFICVPDISETRQTDLDTLCIT